jgi:DNA-binding GntR family transcriptional regulator
MSSKKLIKKLPKITEDLLEKIALEIVRTGANKTNLKILEMLPSDINTMIKETELTKVPINIRINQLEKVGLVKRWRGTGIVVLTELGKDFMKLIYGYQEIVKSNVMNILKKTYDV